MEKFLQKKGLRRNEKAPGRRPQCSPLCTGKGILDTAEEVLAALERGTGRFAAAPSRRCANRINAGVARRGINDAVEQEGREKEKSQKHVWR